MRCVMFAAVLALAGAAPAAADTLGFLQCTPPAQEFAIAKPSGAARLLVARTAAEWREAWRGAGGAGAAPEVDFERAMVLGAVNAAKEDRVIYRIQLDDAANPGSLEVHLGFSDSLCGSARTRQKTGAHFVVTPRSALPVRFVLDQMVDGHMFGFPGFLEGVETKDLATTAAAAAPRTGKAPLREDAERAVLAALSPAEHKKLLTGPLGGPMKRLPHGWTRLAVTRSADRWSIKYDDFAFEVDVATGSVTRK